MKESISTEELMKIVEEAEKASLINKKERKEPNKYRPRTYKDETCLLYIKNSNIKEGPDLIPTYVIYFHYVEFIKNLKKKPSTKQRFFRTFGQYFEMLRKSEQRYYLIQKETINLTEELIEISKRFDVEYEKKAKNPKRKGQVPCSESELQLT